MENPSMRDDICDKVVRIVGRAGGEKEPVGESDDDSFDLEDAIKPKNKS